MTDYSDDKRTNGMNLVKSYPEKKKLDFYENCLSNNCVIKISLVFAKIPILVIESITFLNGM